MTNTDYYETEPMIQEKPLDIDQLLDMHLDICNEARSLMRSKNQDYRGKDASVFGNLTASTAFGVDPAIGILVRMMDKMKRMESFVHLGEFRTKDESLDDTTMDLINYAVLPNAYLKERRHDSSGEIRPGELHGGGHMDGDQHPPGDGEQRSTSEQPKFGKVAISRGARSNSS